MDVLVERFECGFGLGVGAFDRCGEEGRDAGEVVPPAEERGRGPPVDAVAPAPVEVVGQDEHRGKDFVGFEKGQKALWKYGTALICSLCCDFCVCFL